MLEETLCLVGTGGKPIRKTGKIQTHVRPFRDEREAVEAEIVDDALLG